MLRWQRFARRLSWLLALVLLLAQTGTSRETTTGATGLGALAVRGIVAGVTAGAYLLTQPYSAYAALPVETVPTGSELNPPYANGGTNGSGVHTLTGVLSLSATDVVTHGRGPSAVFTRTYNSNDSRVGPLGPGWTHGYDVRLVDPNNGTGQIVVVGPQGRRDRYTPQGGGLFTPPQGVFTKSLIQHGDGTFTLTFKDRGTWSFDATGRLTQIADRYGNASSLTYDGNGRLATVSDPGGRGSLTFGYDANGRLTTVSNWLSPARVVQFEYDTSGRLTTARDRLNNPTRYAYEAGSSRLTTVTDRRNWVRLTNTYDGQGRVATQKDARNVPLSLSYSGTGATVTYPTTSFASSFQPVLTDVYDSLGFLVSHQVQPAPGETSTWTYTYHPVIGARTSVQGPRGHSTHYCYDVDLSGNPVPGSRGNLARIIAPPLTAGASPPVAVLL